MCTVPLIWRQLGGVVERSGHVETELREAWLCDPGQLNISEPQLPSNSVIGIIVHPHSKAVVGGQTAGLG